MQILVVVANTQARSLRAEVEKGFARTVFGRELGGPKGSAKAVGPEQFMLFRRPKGKQANIPVLKLRRAAVTRANSETSVDAPENRSCRQR